MIKDLIPYDPGVAPDVIPCTVRKLRTNNLILSYCLFASIIVAGYFAYLYFETNDDK